MIPYIFRNIYHNVFPILLCRLLAANAIYTELYSDPKEKSIPATFQVKNRCSALPLGFFKKILIKIRLCIVFGQLSFFLNFGLGGLAPLSIKEQIKIMFHRFR